jgi:hypothetical protein
MTPRILPILCAMLLTTTAYAAEPPTDGADREKLIGQPVALEVMPAKIDMKGSRAVTQVVVTGKYADGTVRDLTPVAEYKLENDKIASLDEGGYLSAIGAGKSTLSVKVGSQVARVPVEVHDFDKPNPISFRHDVIAALNVGGCNSGACHGTPSGKNGFKLSLRGFDPDVDFLQLTRDQFGRRTERIGNDSLLLLKGLGRVPHEGGARFPASSIGARTLATWFAEGLQDDKPELPALQRVEVLPGARQLAAPGRWQQLSVIGHFADGSQRDVTRLSVFSSSDEIIARVSPSGLVEFSSSGEVAITVRYLMELVPVRIIYLEPKEGFKWPTPPENNYVDKNVFAKLKMLSIEPSELCTDNEFVRRAYLDICGVLPTGDEVKSYLADKAGDKRVKLVDVLLDRPEYSDFWTLKWSDVLRSTRKTIQVKGTYVFRTWMHGHLERNTPFDEIVRELIASNGSTYSNPAANYYRIAREPTTLAETTAQLFFGVRLQCAKCHNHPYERWTQDDYYSMAAWFARVKQKPDFIDGGDKQKKDGAEFIYASRDGEVSQPRTNKTMAPKFLGGAVPTVPANRDRRDVLAAWMTSSDNPFVAKSIVNRVWFHLLGRGIVDPVDDFRDSNPSANDELLDALAKDFTSHKFDLKHLIRTIALSRTYQLSAQTNAFNKDDTKYFSHAVTKLLGAEQLFDAICAVTDRPEKFANLPLGTRAVQLPDGEANHPFLKAFGQPARELACECERESESNLGQALQLINGATVNDRLRDPKNRIGQLLEAKIAPREMLDRLFLSTLSRPPTEPEVAAMIRHVDAASDPRKAWEDVQWALINSKEFLFRH